MAVLLLQFAFLLSCTLPLSSSQTGKCIIFTFYITTLYLSPDGVTRSPETVSLVSRGSSFCPGEVATFTCRVRTTSGLLWATDTTIETPIFTVASSVGDTVNLGLFVLTVVGVLSTRGVVEFNSTATTLAGVELADNGTRLRCFDLDTLRGEEVVLRVSGNHIHSIPLLLVEKSMTKIN